VREGEAIEIFADCAKKGTIPIEFEQLGLCTTVENEEFAIWIHGYARDFSKIHPIRQFRWFRVRVNCDLRALCERESGTAQNQK
jgi:hypothetical protein